MRQIAIMTMVFLCACSTEAPGDQGLFLDSSVDEGITDQEVQRDYGLDIAVIDQGRGTSLLGEPCGDDLDCASAHHVCHGSACEYRSTGACDRRITGDNTERLCSVSTGTNTYVVWPLASNSIPDYWVWCLPTGCTETNQAPTCLQDSDCAGHFENPDCYFNVCRTLNCPTPLATTGCRSGEICSGLNLCVEN